MFLISFRITNRCETHAPSRNDGASELARGKITTIAIIVTFEPLLDVVDVSRICHVMDTSAVDNAQTRAVTA